MELFVTGCGYGRCGTTWMQQYLSTLDGVSIAGQPTVFALCHIECLINELRSRTDAGLLENNELGYTQHIAPAYAEILSAVRCMVESLWFHNTPIRGAKLEGQSVNDPMVRLLWPDAKYVTCVRHPRKCFESLISTFQPHLTWSVFIKRWNDSVAASLACPDTFVFHIDRHSADTLSRLREFVGAVETESSDSMIGVPVHTKQQLKSNDYVYTNESLALMELLDYE